MTSHEDLSFLDDLDIDELAECLNKCQDTVCIAKCEDTLSDQNGLVRSPGVKTSEDLNKNRLIKEKGQSSKKNIEIFNDDYEDNNKRRLKASLKNINLLKSDERLASRLLKRIKLNFHEEYSISSLIHSGKYSKIFKCKDPAGRHYAVKVLNEMADNEYLSKEKEKLLLQIQTDIHEKQYFCVSFRPGFSMKGCWCFFMDFFPLTLQQVLEEGIKPFDIKAVQDLARQLVDAVTMLSYNNIIHSDIKPSHILMNSSKTVLKLCGFDDAYYLKPPYISSNIGTLNYRSPEIILGHSASFSIDVWSTATVLYEMATNQLLFPGLSNNDILYEQMCLLGDMPNAMLENSTNKLEYFTENMFKRHCFGGEVTILKDRRQFYCTNKITSTVFSIHFKYHFNILVSGKELKKYKNKIYSFLGLIHKMLVFQPEDRITMETAYLDPFIYGRFD